MRPYPHSLAPLAVLTAGLLGGVAPAGAQPLPVTAHVTADNHYALYVGTADGSSLTFIGRNEYGSFGNPGDWDWSLPETWTFQIPRDGYLYVAAWSEAPIDGASMLLGDFLAPGAVLVTNKAQWQATVLSTDYPGNWGDAPLFVLQSAIAAGAWSTPLEWTNALEPGRNWMVFGLYPQAKPIWPDAGETTNFVLFRSPATNLLPTTVALTALADADADGIPNALDDCGSTPAGTAVDASGCSLAQFCGQVAIVNPISRQTCKALDWQNDQPLMQQDQADCKVDKGPKAGKRDDLCLPARP